MNGKSDKEDYLEVGRESKRTNPVQIHNFNSQQMPCHSKHIVTDDTCNSTQLSISYSKLHNTPYIFKDILKPWE